MSSCDWDCPTQHGGGGEGDRLLPPPTPPPLPPLLSTGEREMGCCHRPRCHRCPCAAQHGGEGEEDGGGGEGDGGAGEGDRGGKGNVKGKGKGKGKGKRPASPLPPARQQALAQYSREGGRERGSTR